MQFGLYLLSIGIVLFSQMLITNQYKKYRAIDIESGLTGYDVAKRILESNNLAQVDVVMQEKGVLSDFYDPKSNTVSLSPSVYNDSSVASIAIAAHECGHAIQYATGYKIIGVRNRIMPLAIASSNLSIFLIIAGLILSSSLVGQMLVTIGLVMFGIVAVFQLVTLPIEFNASSRALALLQTYPDITEDELDGSKSMLKAAAFTYVASLLSTIIQILRIIVIRGNNKNN